MGKNFKGGKNRKRGKNHNQETQVKVVLNLAKEGQEYARCTKMLGNCRLIARCYNDKGVGKERLCIIPGKFRKRVYINVGDIILVSIRSFQDDKVDVIYKYPPPEAKKLIRKGLIPEEGEGKFKQDNGSSPFGVGIEFVGQGDDDDEEEAPKKKERVVRNTDGGYIADDLLPPSDSDSEEDLGGKVEKPQKKVTFGADFEFDEEEEINLEDL